MKKFFKEFFEFLFERKKFWLYPIVWMLLLFGSLIVLTQGTAVAPLFILYFK